MDVIVNRDEMIGFAANYRLQRRDNFLRALFRCAVWTPEPPGVQVHSGLGEQRSGIEIVGETLYHVAHGIAILFRGGAQIGFGIGGKALRKRGDVSLVALGSIRAERQRFLNGGVGLRKTAFAGGIVVIGADGFGDAPIRHGQFGIEFRGALEGAHGFVVIESVDESQTLIEKYLRLRVLGGDWVMPIAVARHERSGFYFGGCGALGMFLRESGLTLRESGDT